MKLFAAILTTIASLVSCGVAQAVPASMDAPWLYYADNDLRTVSRLHLDGSPPQLLINTAPILTDLDVFAGKLYWLNGGDGSTTGGSIKRANLDGTNPQVVYAPVSGASESVGGMAIDEVNSQIFWLDQIGNRILRMPLAGGTPSLVIKFPARILQGAIEVDPLRGHVYFSSGGTGQGSAAFIERVNYDGSDRQTVAEAYAFGMSVDSVGQQLYMADFFQHRIRRVGLDGTGLTTIVSGTLGPRDVQVVGDKLYYPNIISQAANGTGPYFYQWARSALDGTNQEILWKVPRLEGPHDMIAFAVTVPEPAGCGLAAIILSATAVLQRRGKRQT